MALLSLSAATKLFFLQQLGDKDSDLLCIVAVYEFANKLPPEGHVLAYSKSASVILMLTVKL